MSTTTMNQRQRATVIMREMVQRTTPHIVTAGEAARLCGRYGVTNTEYHQCPQDLKQYRLVSLAAVAFTIAKKESNS